MADTDITIRVTAQDATGAALGSVRKELTGLDDAAKKSTTSTGALGGSLKTVGSVAAGFGLATSLMELPGILQRGAEAAAADMAAMDRLKQAVENAGGSWDEYGGALENIISKSEDLAFSDGESAAALSLLISLTGSAEEGMERFALAQDLARGAGIGLEQASRLLGKVSEENTSALGRLGISLGSAATEMDVLAAVQQKFGGQAVTYSESAAGGYARFQIQVQELTETLGQGLLPVFDALGGKIEMVVTVLQPLAGITGQFLGNMMEYGPILGAAETALNQFGLSLDSVKSTVVDLVSGPIGAVVDGINAVAGAASSAASAVGGFLGIGGGGGVESMRITAEEARNVAAALDEMAVGYGIATTAADFSVSAFDASQHSAIATGQAASDLASQESALAAALDEATAAAQNNTSAFLDNEQANNNVQLAALELQLAQMEAAGATDEETAAVRGQIDALNGANAVIDAGRGLLEAYTSSLGVNAEALGISERDAADLAVTTTGLATQFGDAEGAVRLANDALFWYGGEADNVTGAMLTLADNLNLTTIPAINGVGQAVFTLPSGKTVTIDANDLATADLNWVQNYILNDKWVNIWANTDAFWRDVNALPNYIPVGTPGPFGYAEGTSSATPGLHWVGENGPELMRFRGGEQVFSHQESMAMAGGGGGTQVIQLVVDGRVLAETVNGRNNADARSSGLFGR